MRRICSILLCVVIVFAMPNAFAADKDALQRGRVFFMNYCAGCHSLKYMRPPNLIAMPPVDARQWFGRMPPDLSLTARARGPAWIRTYLTSFYPDSSRPFGANNTLMPYVAMPNVLWSLQNNSQLKDDLDDLSAFLMYVAEPSRLIRYRLGLLVMAFLGVLGVLIWRLKILCWRNIC